MEFFPNLTNMFLASDLETTRFHLPSISQQEYFGLSSLHTKLGWPQKCPISKLEQSFLEVQTHIPPNLLVELLPSMAQSTDFCSHGSVLQCFSCFLCFGLA